MERGSAKALLGEAARRPTSGAETDLDLLGPALLLVAQLPDGTDFDPLDLGRQVVAGDDDSIPPAHGQAAGPLARNVIRVADRQPPLAGNPRLEMERVPGMFLDGQVETPDGQLNGLSIDRDQNALLVQGPGHLAIASQPLGTIRARQTADQGTEILGQGQLRQADLVIDLEAAGPDGDLDRSIDPLVGNIVGPRRAARPGSPAQARPKTARQAVSTAGRHETGRGQL